MSTDFMSLALELAKTARDQGEVPVGAVVVKNGVVIGRGYNRRERDNDPTSHAEIEAIREAAKNLSSWRLEDCEMFVTLEPCPMCLSALMHSRIRSVTYAAQDPKGGAVSLGIHVHQHPKLNHRFDAKYAERAEASSILSDFFKALRAAKP